MKVDMSPKAITARLKATSELRDLCIALGGDRLREKIFSTLSEECRQKILLKKKETQKNSSFL
ncbi:hypothetical protein MTBBW1_850037 [Desulfamplus magnetovallimortis]|uniref:Uncharacterized protein n=1 Tax=Desulfamplus magnetovallimortis TaxID=1246637 RepID=A0A1W1HKQ4_9BACT|nr:hypothetical protein [Desulfamplus magnetovallimortis]SLM33049.1 hypothetical protein MTBBW1_850037 [Desulfamplus magnetovallimortis]